MFSTKQNGEKVKVELIYTNDWTNSLVVEMNNVSTASWTGFKNIENIFHFLKTFSTQMGTSKISLCTNIFVWLERN